MTMLASPLVAQAPLARRAKATISAPRHNAALNMQARVSRRPLQVAYGTKVAEAELDSKAAKKEEKRAKEEEEEEEDFEGDEGLSPQQVESLLTILCEETEIAEVSLKMGGFRMRVRRSLKNGAAAVAAAAVPAPVVAPAPVAAAPAPVATPAAAASYDSEEEGEHQDESLAAITSSKVGILRRGRYVKGKQVGKGPVVEVGDIIKRGQTLCYVEQLGTHWPVEATTGGELTSFEVEEGGPVEYKQVVAHIRPEFGSSDPGFGLRK